MLSTIDDYYFYVRFFVTSAVSKLVRMVLSSEINNILTPTQKNAPDTLGRQGGIIEIIFFQPNQTNNISKERHGSEDNRTFVPEK